MTIAVLRCRATRTITVSTSVIKLTGAPVTAQAALNPTGTNNNITFRSVAPGVIGNGFSVVLVDPGANNAPFSFEWAGLAKVLTVNLATGGGGAITTTAQILIDAIAADRALTDVIRLIPGEALSSGILAGVTIATFTGGAAGTGDFALPWSGVRIHVSSNNARMRGDLGDPAAAAGLQLLAGQSYSFMLPNVDYRLYFENLRLIREGGSDAVFSIEYYSK